MGRRRRSPGFLWTLFFGGLISAPIPGHSQVDEGPSVHTNPSPVALGQLFHLEIRVRTPQGWILEIPDSVEGLRGIRSGGPPVVVRSDVGPEGRDWTMAYPLIPLRTGYRPFPSLSLRMRDPGALEGEGSVRRVQVPLGGITVQSVLPPPGQAVDPAPPLLPSQSGSGQVPITLLSLMGVFLSGSGWLATRMRPGLRTGAPAPASSLDGPSQDKQSLLAQLQRIIGSAPSSPSDTMRVFDETGFLVRRILEHQTSANLAGFTTPELMTVLSDGRPEQELRSLERVLRLGDQARFQETLPSPGDVRGFQQELVTWMRATGEGDHSAGAGGSDV